MEELASFGFWSPSKQSAPDVLKTHGNKRCCQVVVKKHQRISREDLTVQSHQERTADGDHITVFLGLIA